MTSNSPAQRSCSTGEANAAVSNNRRNGRCPRQTIRTRISVKASPVISKQSLNAEHAPRQNGLPLQSPWITLALESLSSKNETELVSLLDPQNLAWSPSTATPSTVSSQSSGNDVWDAPETPCHSSSKASLSKTLGTLTPPTPPVSPSFDEKFVGQGTRVDEDAFQPKKLFRNLTLELEAMSKANVAAASVNFDPRPSFSFSLSLAELRPVSSRTRSKVGTILYSKGSDTVESKPISSRTCSKVGTILHFKGPDTIERTISIVNAQTSKAPLARSKLPSLLEHILPLKIHSRLSTSMQVCVGSGVKTPSKRCSYQHRGSMSDANICFQKIATCREKKDYQTMLACIEGLVRETMCGRHRNIALRQPENPKARIVQLRKLLTDTTPLPEEDRSKIDEWLNVISDPKAATEHVLWLSAPPMADKNASASTNATHRPSMKVTPAPPRVQIPGSSKFTPFQERKTVLLTVSEALQDQIKKPLGAGDYKEGFIYIFWDKEHFGRLKIGHTNDLKRRLKDWDRQCNREHSYHPNGGTTRVTMPHVLRVERLIHAELKNFREKRMCEGCGKTHIEWFQIEETHAVKVARKWQEWIMRKPYVFDEGAQEWVLRREMAGELDHICEPLPREEATPTQPTKRDKARSIKRSKTRRVTV